MTVNTLSRAWLPAAQLPPEFVHLREARISVNVIKLFDRTGWSTILIGSANSDCSPCPIAPRQLFGTLSVAF